MDREKMIKKVSQKLQKKGDIKYTIHRIPYKVIFQKPDSDNGINIPSIIAIPKSKDICKRIVLESNNLESGDLEQILEQGTETAIRLINLTDNKPTVIVVPLIPSYRDAPYFQQLSRECFELPTQDRNYRMDEQIVRIVDITKNIVKEQKGIDLEDKIFLNGYSSSGVFAQRFTLLQPELIDTACIGGASGSIPIPTEEFCYPIGIADYKKITGKEFDMNSYSQIRFKYYVGELETQDKTDTRFDEKGNPAPMYDMSYFNRSVPTDVGERQRIILGRDLFARAEKTIEILKSLGIKVEHTVIPGRAHDNRNGIGVNEVGDKIVNDAYKESMAQQHEEMHQAYISTGIKKRHNWDLTDEGKQTASSRKLICNDEQRKRRRKIRT